MSTFNDHYLDLDYDLSDVMFITTANTLSGIPVPLQDRTEVTQLSGYTEFEELNTAPRSTGPTAASSEPFATAPETGATGTGDASGNTTGGDPTAPVGQAEAMEVLKQQRTLRIFIPRAPGNGHQGSSVQLMLRLGKLGFSGDFDVIYDDAPPATEEDSKKYGSNPAKLKNLLPGFRPAGPPVQSFETLGLKVNVMGLKTFQDQKDRRPAKYGLTGAVDNHERPRDILKELGVDSFVQLQPLNWNRESGRRGVTYRDTQDKEQFHEVEALAGLGYIYDTTPPDNSEAMIKEELAKSGTSAKEPGVLAFLAQTESGNAHTMIAYGLGTGMPQNTQAPAFELFNLVTGVMYAQDDETAGTDIKDKGAIVGAAGWVDKDEIATLKKLLDGEWEGGLQLLVDREGNARQEDWEELVDYLKGRLLKDGRPRARVVNIEDPNAPEIIAGVGPHEVLVVEFSPGRLPMPVFEHLRSKTSLPNSFESVNGTDKERQNKPYIHVGKNESNNFPRSDELGDVPQADSMANRAELIGRQLQGRDGLDSWLASYDHNDRIKLFTNLSKLKPAVKLKSPKKGEQNALVTIDVSGGFVRAGKVGTNGRPGPKNIFYSPSEVRKLYDINKDLITEKLRNRNPDRLIGQYINDAQKKDTPLRQYFDALKAQSTSKDQVALAFTELVNVDMAPPAPPAEDDALWTAPETAASTGSDEASGADGSPREALAPQDRGAPAGLDGTGAIPAPIDALVRTLVARSGAWSSPRTQADKQEAVELVTELLQLFGMDAKVVDRTGAQDTNPDSPGSDHSTCTCVR